MPGNAPRNLRGTEFAALRAATTPSSRDAAGAGPMETEINSYRRTWHTGNRSGHAMIVCANR